LNLTKKSKDIVIFDRGYPSKAMIKYMNDTGYKYIFHLNKKFNAEIDNSDKKDFNIIISDCNVRVIKLILPNNEIEMLATNLSKTAFKTVEFNNLYHLRWGVETKYNTLKNKLDIENFSGKTIITFLQDFYATMFLSNIAAAIKA
jgi:hypothetical protein